MNVKELESAVQVAADRLRGQVKETPLEPSVYLGQLSGAEVFCKLENLQHTGSFKVRGAMNKLLSLSDEERRRGVVTASTGNHGAAVARAMKALEVDGLVCVTENASAAKLAAIERLGARIYRVGSDCMEAKTFARHHAIEKDMTYVSPYNDPEVVAGQGTIGVELARQLEGIDQVFIALGGGGLLAGVAAALKARQPGVRVVGCSPANSAVMIASVRAGQILELPSEPTLSDGTAGGVEAGAITFGLCRELVDDCVTVSEEEIAGSLREFIEAEHLLVESAAAVPVAAFRRTGRELAGKRVVIVICGANIALETLQGVV